MRLLFVSNLFPPHHIGGYELVCQRTAEGMRERGHDVHVLTSTFGSGPRDEGELRRRLFCAYRPPDYFPDAGPAEAQRNARLLSDEISRLQPAVTVLWNLHGLGMHLLFRTALSEARQVATRLGDYQFWPNWDPAQPIPREGLSVLLDPRLRVAANCTTLGTALARVGARSNQIAILRASVESPWDALPSPPPSAPPLRLLWAGRIGTQKGLSVATDAVVTLAELYRVPTRFDLVGRGDESLLKACLSRTATAALVEGVALQVRYLGPTDREGLAQLFPQYHAYLAPSVGHEAFPMTCVEAMAAGTPVVASRLGGLVEIAGEGRRGLLFEPGDATGMARQLRRLATDRRLWERLRAAGREYVDAHFGRQVSIDRFEAFLVGCAEGLPVAAMPSSVPRLSHPEPRRPVLVGAWMDACRRIVRRSGRETT